ncbi:hypothetical protein D3C85_219750 [compost metagenome]
MKDGLTTSLTGESQPMRTLPTEACKTFMPRVGTTESFIVPLSMSTMLTPSCRPPCKVRRVTEKGLSVFTPSCWLVICQFCAALSLSSRT